MNNYVIMRLDTNEYICKGSYPVKWDKDVNNAYVIRSKSAASKKLRERIEHNKRHCNMPNADTHYPTDLTMLPVTISIINE